MWPRRPARSCLPDPWRPPAPSRRCRADARPCSASAGKHAGPDTDGDPDLAAIHLDRRAQAGDESIGHQLDIGRRLGAADDEGELVLAGARHRVGLADVPATAAAPPPAERRSPAPWPKLSLIAFRSSMSHRITPTSSSERRAWAICLYSSSCSRARPGRRVSGSWRPASCTPARRSAAARRPARRSRVRSSAPALSERPPRLRPDEWPLDGRFRLRRLRPAVGAAKPARNRRGDQQDQQQRAAGNGLPPDSVLAPTAPDRWSPGPERPPAPGRGTATTRWSTAGSQIRSIGRANATPVIKPRLRQRSRDTTVPELPQPLLLVLLARRNRAVRDSGDGAGRRPPPAARTGSPAGRARGRTAPGRPAGGLRATP